MIHSIKHSVVDNINNGKSDRFVVDAQCNKGCELVYAFFVSDSVGDKRITEGENGYTESNVFTCPVTPWEYRVSVRVKHKKNSDILEQNEQNPLLLPNAYEALESILVKGDYIEDTIKIKNIQIEPFILTDYYNEKQKWNSIMQTITDSSKNGTVYANNNNYITINIQEEGHYGYDAWVIDDGEQITLEKVEDGESSNRGNKFIYYPKSGGRSGVAANPNETHTLFIQVTQYDEYGYITKKLTKKYTLEVE